MLALVSPAFWVRKVGLLQMVCIELPDVLYVTYPLQDDYYHFLKRLNCRVRGYDT